MIQKKRLTIWDDVVINKKDSCFLSINKNYYLTYMYNNLVDEVLNRYVQKTKKYTLLKTDLWNEGVDYDREILGHIKNKYNNLSLYGTDISSEVCILAKKRFPFIKIKHGDIRKLPFKSDTFDFIIDLSTIDHVPENNVNKVITEYNRVLKNEGIVVLVFWKGNFITRKIKKLKDTDVQYYFSAKKMLELTKLRFNISKHFSIGLLLGIPSQFRKKIENIDSFFRLDGKLSNMFTRIERSMFVQFVLEQLCVLKVIVAVKK